MSSSCLAKLVMLLLVAVLGASELCYRSLCDCGDKLIAVGNHLDFMRQVSTFGLCLVKLDIRQDSGVRAPHRRDGCDHHAPRHRLLPGVGRAEVQRQEWLASELRGKRPLFGPDLPQSDDVAEARSGAPPSSPPTASVCTSSPWPSRRPTCSPPSCCSGSAAPGGHNEGRAAVREARDLQRAGAPPRHHGVPLLHRLVQTAVGGRQEIMIGYSDSASTSPCVWGSGLQRRVPARRGEPPAASPRSARCTTSGPSSASPSASWSPGDGVRQGRPWHRQAPGPRRPAAVRRAAECQLRGVRMSG